MPAGSLDRRITIYRRAVIEAEAGNERGEFRPVQQMWAGYRPMAASTRGGYGIAEDIDTGWLTLRESSLLDGLTNADRVGFGPPVGSSQVGPTSSGSHAIVHVPEKDRSGFRVLRIERRMS